MSYELKIISHFWRKESNSLFDYETTDMTTSNINTSNNCLVFYEGHVIRKVKDRVRQKSLNYLITVLGGEQEYKLKIDDGYYSPGVDCNPRINSDNWVVIRHTVLDEENGFELAVGSTIKLGKVIFKVKDVFVESAKEKSREDEDVSDILRLDRGRVGLDRNLTNNENFAGLNRVEDEEEGGGEGDGDGDGGGVQHSRDNNYDISANDFSNNMLIHSNTNTNNQNILANLNLNIPDDLSNNNNTSGNNEISYAKKMKSIISTGPNKNSKKKYSKVKSLTHNINVCRICLGDGSEDKLLSICKCIGTVKYIHLGCLRRWLVSKVSIKTYNHLTVFSYKNLECELCKSVIPDRIKIRDKLVSLINPNVIAESALYSDSQKYTSYIALECVKDKPLPVDHQEKKTVYIINMKDKTTLKLGRATDSDVRMTDISVSRNHAMLKLSNGKMYLKDNNSKFGTHINADLNQEMKIIPFKQLALQCGRFFLLFNLGKTCWSYLCCNKGNLNRGFSRGFYSNYNQGFKEYFTAGGREIKMSENGVRSEGDDIKIAEFEEDEEAVDKRDKWDIIDKKEVDVEVDYKDSEDKMSNKSEKLNNVAKNDKIHTDDNNIGELDHSIDISNMELIKLKTKNSNVKKKIVLNKITASASIQMTSNDKRPLNTGRNIRRKSLRMQNSDDLTKSKLQSYRGGNTTNTVLFQENEEEGVCINNNLSRIKINKANSNGNMNNFIINNNYTPSFILNNENDISESNLKNENSVEIRSPTFSPKLPNSPQQK